ncbi:uncharacterized protein LOC143915942 isoform X2 [Arctopsyche grandis]|uniref:uncharacterized protein LOC143915942 isoform X2 n=1 Tax=Arctopsyche grandis TaxID=121162 RepID=UPI00406D80B9
MTMTVLLLCCTVLAICTSASAYLRDENPLAESTGLDAARRDLISMVDKVITDVEDPNSKRPGRDVEVAKVFDAFDQRLKRHSSPYDSWYKGKVVESFWVWTVLAKDLAGIDKMYATFARFVRHQANERVQSPHSDWMTLINGQLSGRSAHKSAEQIDKIVIHGSLYRQILEEAKRNTCAMQMSMQQIIYNTYNTVNLAQIKAYAMTQFSLILLKIYEDGNSTDEAIKARDAYQKRISTEMVSLKSALVQASRTVLRCDPHRHEEGKTYVALTRLLQGYVENEVDMNDQNACRENCAYYQVAKNHGCFKDQFCSRQPPCNGKILSCTYIDSDMSICPSSKTSSRRYEWIEYENGRVLGKKGSCMRGQTKVDSWWRWGLYHCSYCLCVCDEPSTMSDRYVSMDEVTADVLHQKVVTGLRFVKVNRVINIQISEGKLLPGGKIDQNSVTWSEVKSKNLKYSVRGKDYHEMSNEERAIDLDDLEGPQGYVLTGVRFKKLGSHLNFEIQVMPYNFTTGELNSHKYEWISNDNTDASAHKPRSKLSLRNPDVPTSISIPSVVLSTSDQFIEFTHSDFDKDAAQSTVPFLDAQPVVSDIHVPLSGAGLYHKGMMGSGGFIAPKIITYDYSQHINDNIPVFLIDDMMN